MVRDRARVWVIVSVGVRFRVGIWDTFSLLFRERVEVISFRTRVRMRVRVDLEVSVCFWGLQYRHLTMQGLAQEHNMCVSLSVCVCVCVCVCVIG